MQRAFLSLLAIAGGNFLSRVSSVSPSSLPSSSPYANVAPRALFSSVPPEVYYDTAQLTKKWGYPVEKHVVTTEDGYKISVYRIPGSKMSPPRPQKPVIFLQHGLAQSSDQWVIRGPQEDLVFLLADRGYDVWMGNYRGNQYGRAHTTLSVRDLAFWKFSWHENGYYDVAASIRLALAVAKVPNLLYIGHSMGTSSAFVLLSSRPEFNQLVRAAFLLAPVALLREVKGLASPALAIGRIIEAKIRRHDVHLSVLPRTSILSKFIYNFCSPPHDDLCVALYYTVAGYSPDQLNATAFPVVMAHMPAGSSLGQLRHYVQCYVSGQLLHFDHGTQENIRIYGSRRPPPYPLEQISTPTLIFYSKGDYLATDADVLYLSKMLPNVRALEKVPLDSFNHADFLWGVDSYRLLYEKLLKYIEES